MQNKKTLVVAGVILLLVVFAFVARSSKKNVTATPTKSPTTRQPVTPTPAIIRSTMFFEPETVSVKPNQQFTVTVAVDAKGVIVNGIDSIILFDPESVRPISVQKAKDAGNEFYLLRKQIDPNKIILTAAKTKYTATPTLRQSVASITFKSLKPGTTSLSFDFKPGSTTASTIIEAEKSTNILDAVKPLSVSVQ